jgi:hypothetical protein
MILLRSGRIHQRQISQFSCGYELAAPHNPAMPANAIDCIQYTPVGIVRASCNAKETEIVGEKIVMVRTTVVKFFRRHTLFTALSIRFRLMPTTEILSFDDNRHGACLHKIVCTIN